MSLDNQVYLTLSSPSCRLWYKAGGGDKSSRITQFVLLFKTSQPGWINSLKVKWWGNSAKFTLFHFHPSKKKRTENGSAVWKQNVVYPNHQYNYEVYKLPVPSKVKFIPTREGTAKKLICLLCKEDHRLGKCKIFTDKSLEDRMILIRDHGCCFRCLSKGHLSRDCTSRKKCIVDNCGQAHYSLLHDAPRIPSAPDRETNEKVKSILKQTAKSVTLPLNVACQWRTISRSRYYK